jgi:excisionase family DNA binding protein
MIYSVKEAAQKLGISDGYCRWLLERGQIKGKKLGHDWVVLSLDYKRKRKPKQKGGQSGEKDDVCGCRTVDVFCFYWLFTVNAKC